MIEHKNGCHINGAYKYCPLCGVRMRDDYVEFSTFQILMIRATKSKDPGSFLKKLYCKKYLMGPDTQAESWCRMMTKNLIEVIESLGIQFDIFDIMEEAYAFKPMGRSIYEEAILQIVVNILRFSEISIYENTNMIWPTKWTQSKGGAK